MCTQSTVKFNNGELEIDVAVSALEETVWLNRQQISMLFDRDVKTTGKHINNIFREDEKSYDVEYYNLDVIILVGFDKTPNSAFTLLLALGNELGDGCDSITLIKHL